MRADVILQWIALGSALLPVYVAVIATVFCRRALHDGGEFEAEIQAPMRTFVLRMRATGPVPGRTLTSEKSSEHDSAGVPTTRH